MYLEANFLAHGIEQNYPSDAVYGPHEGTENIYHDRIRKVCVTVYRHNWIVTFYDKLHREGIKRYYLE